VREREVTVGEGEGVGRRGEGRGREGCRESVEVLNWSRRAGAAE